MPKLIDRTAVVLRPKHAFLDWLHGCPDPPDFITLESIQEDGANIYLIKEIVDLSKADAVLRKLAPRILEAELAAWYTNEDAWPEKLDYKTLKRLFEVRVESMVVDMVDRPIRREEL